MSILEQFFTPTVHLATLLITATSAYYVYKQQTTEYQQVKNLIVSVHLLYIAIVVSELIRNFDSDPGFMTVYTVSNTTFVLADVLILTLVALAISLRPKGSGIRGIIGEVRKHRTHFVLLSIFVGYIAFAEFYLLFSFPLLSQVPPYTIVQLTNTVGNSVAATSFTAPMLNMLLGVLILFVAFPSTLLFLARRRTSDIAVRRALLLLPVAWISIGLDLLIFNGYLLTVGVDASALGYLFATSAFAVSASIFRGATLISGLFIQVPAVPRAQVPTVGGPFSARIGSDQSRIIGKNMLLEVEPSANFEELIGDFAREFSAAGFLIFAFTLRGSPTYSVLSTVEGVRFYTLSTKVSYPKASDRPNEMLVPQNDQAVLLNVLDKTVSSNPQVRLMIIFDSISDLILSSGFDGSYKFLRQANEIVNEAGLTAVFLLMQGAHSERESNIIKSLFANQIEYAGAGLRVAKIEQ